MSRRAAIGFGVVAILGGLLAVLANVPARWYGVPQTGAYLFDPAPLSPLWISRTVVPVLSVLAVLGLLAGLTGLVGRDWSDYGRAGRWGGGGALLGLAGLALSVGLIGGGPGAQTAEAALQALVGLAVGAGGVLLLVPGLLLLGYDYLRRGRHWLGVALVGVPVGVPVVGGLVPAPASSVGAMLPVGLAWTAIGYDLLRAAVSLDRTDER
ncbi:MAG: hypothetical protein ABEJ76_09315 [Halanaeroarchaeum sp.]